MSQLRQARPAPRQRRDKIGDPVLAKPQGRSGALAPDEASRFLGPLLRGAPSVLLAVSGGPDSVALMRLCAALRREGLTCELEVATVDHGLRVESGAEAEEVSLWARQCGLAHHILIWEGEKPHTRLQERARAARYALLAARAKDIGARLLLTAHTLDDQAETLLMRMAHGSGLAGLGAMRSVVEHQDLRHGRPFLSVRKARLVATCRTHHWPFFDDPTNADDRFARSRWRKLLPGLAQEGLTPERLGKLAERAASAEEALCAKAEEAFAATRLDEGSGLVILDMAQLLAREPRAIALRVLLAALAELGESKPFAPLRLERVENAFSALEEAVSSRKPTRRTLAGALLSCDTAGILRIAPEGVRHRGKSDRDIASPKDSSLRLGPAKAGKGNANAPMALA